MLNEGQASLVRAFSAYLMEFLHGLFRNRVHTDYGCLILVHS